MEKTWLEQPRLCLVWVHRTVRWCTGQCPVRQAGIGPTGRSREFVGGVRLKITGLSGGAPDCPVSQRSAAQSTRDAWPSQRSDGGTGLSGVHRTVSGAPTAPNLQRSAVAFLESNQHQTLNSACPVRHPTEGKNCLPGLLSTAPSCLGAIKGTPRRMEENTKHTLNILRLPHSIFAHSIDILSDLSSVLVVNLLCFI